MPKKRPLSRGTPAKPDSGRLTYRELRNTPGKVWERLANAEPLTLMAEGQAKALLIPLPDGDVATALEAYRRGRAMLTLRAIRQKARTHGTAGTTLAQINAVIREVRAERHRRGLLE